MFGQSERFLNQLLVLNQVSLDIKKIVSLENIRRKILCIEFDGCTQISGHCSFRIGTHHCQNATGFGNRIEKNGVNPVNSHVFFEKFPQFVVPDFPHKRCFHAEVRQTVDGVCRRAT